jgi:hypothetical protein
VTADHQKVVRTQEDLKVDLLEDQKEDLQEAVILTDPAMTQEPHVDLEHREQNQAIVFQENANHSIVRAVSAVHLEIASHLMANANHIKEEIVNHSIATTVKVVSAVHSETASHLMASVSRTKAEIANHLTGITAKVENANPIKAANASLLAELKIQRVHPIKAIIAGIAMRPLK